LFIRADIPLSHFKKKSEDGKHLRKVKASEKSEDGGHLEKVKTVGI
jgi:hypothetical protein